ncbi:hypothetical protein MKX03_037891 [Papaver bracteatum]|nr:hypothetical protein MKX03_037891 [Papaver bracteatum]
MGYNSRFCRRLNGVEPTLVMVVVQIVFAGMNVFYKLAMNDGMNTTILVAYRSLYRVCSSSCFLLRKENHTEIHMDYSLLQAFLCGLFWDEKKHDLEKLVKSAVVDQNEKGGLRSKKLMM